MASLHHIWIVYALFLLCMEYLCKGIAKSEEISSTRERIDARTILEAFCNVEHKLNVIECVDEETDSLALLPWKFCLNVDRNLSRKELITLSCKSLYPGYKEVFDILTACVDDLMSPEEAATWMPVLKLCEHRTMGKTQTARTAYVDIYETPSTSEKFY